MPYNEAAAERVREMLRRRRGFTEKKMFGGIGFLLHGNMCIGIWNEFLILRLGIDRYEDALNAPLTREFDITGRAMRGWVMVEPEGFAEAAELKDWIESAIRFVRMLPKKA